MIEYVVFFLLLTLGIVFYIMNEIRIRKLGLESEDIGGTPESPIEWRLYKALIFRGEIVEPQVPCGKYRIDLALKPYRIAIECDGKEFHSSPEQIAHDRRKNKYLRKNGWKVLRFSGSAINGRMGQVLERIDSEKNR
ncbi:MULTISPECIES: DUF559 domain-containing protein [Bacteria]|uniref:endonuclease domain-containing protein n=1 Tax=Bacteria TaxID=2 RepID=UPI0007D791F8